LHCFITIYQKIVVTQDTGFDILIQHLKGNKIFVNRYEQMNDIPALKKVNSVKFMPEEKIDLIVDYLIKRGIENQVLIPKGYGESRLINHCKNKVRCSSSQHQENRRVEIIILSLQ